mmetsp:Transcript_122347/g.318038  ORF Transcript_122347/g.318038 Transcript_122347/m.318038 type:complete len:544 (-) Transcript_122347:226-1857(-)
MTPSSPQEAPAAAPVGGTQLDGIGLRTCGGSVVGAGVQHRRSFCTLLCGLFLAGLCLVSCALQVQLYRKFTPVYTKTECGNQTATMDRMALGIDSIDIGLQIEVTCRNPNPYAIKILASTPGQVFVQLSEDQAKEKVPIGKLRVLPGSSLGEESGGVVRVRMDTSVKGELVPHFLSDVAVPLMMVLQFDVSVSMSFGLVRWSLTAPFKKSCGLRVAGILVNRFLPEDNSERSQRLGPLICRDAFDSLLPQLPRVGEKAETPEDGNMGFSAAQVAPQEVGVGEVVKTVSLGTSIALSWVSCIVLSFGSLAAFAHAEGLKGLLSDVRGGCRCSLLVGYAWNGSLDMLTSVLSVMGIASASSGWRMSIEKFKRSNQSSSQKACSDRDITERLRSMPLLFVVSARRSDLTEASAYDDEQPPSPRPRPPRSERNVNGTSGDRHRRRRASSAPYMPCGDSVSAAGEASTTPDLVAHAEARSESVAGDPLQCSSCAIVGAAAGPIASASLPKEGSEEPDVGVAFTENLTKQTQSKLGQPAELPESDVITV